MTSKHNSPFDNNVIELCLMPCWFLRVCYKISLLVVPVNFHSQTPDMYIQTCLYSNLSCMDLAHSHIHCWVHCYRPSWWMKLSLSRLYKQVSGHNQLMVIPLCHLLFRCNFPHHKTFQDHIPAKCHFGQGRMNFSNLCTPEQYYPELEVIIKISFSI